jgi:hypothetical protein
MLRDLQTVECGGRLTHGHAVLVTYAGDLADLLGGLGIGHSDRQLVDVDAAPFGVAVKAEIFIIRADGVFVQNGSEFCDCLLIRTPDQPPGLSSFASRAHTPGQGKFSRQTYLLHICLVAISFLLPQRPGGRGQGRFGPGQRIDPVQVRQGPGKDGQGQDARGGPEGAGWRPQRTGIPTGTGPSSARWEHRCRRGTARATQRHAQGRQSTTQGPPGAWTKRVHGGRGEVVVVVVLESKTVERSDLHLPTGQKAVYIGRPVEERRVMVRPGDGQGQGPSLRDPVGERQRPGSGCQARNQTRACHSQPGMLTPGWSRCKELVAAILSLPKRPIGTGGRPGWPAKSWGRDPRRGANEETPRTRGTGAAGRLRLTAVVYTDEVPDTRPDESRPVEGAAASR